MPILDFLSSIFTPIKDIVTNLHTSDAEKMTLHNQMLAIHNQMAEKMLDYETKLMAAQADIIKSEAQGASWLQRTWRPITMMVLLALVVCDSFGWLHSALSHDAWILIQVGMGGYIGSRGVEKVVPSIAAAIKDSKG